MGANVAVAIIEVNDHSSRLDRVPSDKAIDQHTGSRRRVIPGQDDQVFGESLGRSGQDVERVVVHTMIEEDGCAALPATRPSHEVIDPAIKDSKIEQCLQSLTGLALYA